MLTTSFSCLGECWQLQGAERCSLQQQHNQHAALFALTGCMHTASAQSRCLIICLLPPARSVTCTHRDAFNPSAANAARFSNRGGSIFASQLAQHLGLGHSAAATVPTAGGGSASSCLSPQQLPALSSWCSRFRQGQQPLWSELSAATSCPGVVFNVLEPSVPDNCAMTFTALQAAQMQAAVAMWRPKLLAASTAA